MMIRPVRSTTRSLLLLLSWERRVKMGSASTAAVVPMRVIRLPVVRIAPSRMISRLELMVMMVAC